MSTNDNFGDYLTQHNITSLFEELTEKLVKEKPAEPLAFLAEELKKKESEKQQRKVVFVLGGPGTGKGTQCENLAQKYGFIHFSAGDLLRKAREEDEVHGPLIDECIREGKIVPGQITIALLRKAIFSEPEDKVFLIDGFPREMKQCLDFESQVSPGIMCLFLVCPFDTLKERILNRAKTSGRKDDNLETLEKRFNSYTYQTLPVIEYFKAKGKVEQIDSTKTISEVFDDLTNLFKKKQLLP